MAHTQGHHGRDGGRGRRGVFHCYLCGLEFSHRPVPGVRNGYYQPFCSRECEQTGHRLEAGATGGGGGGGGGWGADRGDGFPVEEHTEEHRLEAGATGATGGGGGGGATRRRAQLDAARLERMAVNGPPCVRARDALPASDIALQRLIERSIDERRVARRELHGHVSIGMCAQESLTRRGMGLHEFCSTWGLRPLEVVRDIWLYYADCRGALAHVGTGLAHEAATEPMTLTQAEIAAGVRDFDGELTGVFAGLG